MDPSKTPVPKMQAAGIGGAVTTIIIAIAVAVGVDVPAEVAAALATLISFAAGYLKPST